MAPRKNIDLVELLPLTVRVREFEPASGLIRRLALRAGHRSVLSFLHTVPYCPTWLAGELDRGRSIEVLSRMSGIDLSVIRNATPYPSEDGTYLNSVQIAYTDRAACTSRAARGRICSLCLLEDRDVGGGPLECRPFRRFWWDMAEFEGCPKHAIAFIDECPGCKLPLHKYLMRPDGCVCGFDLAHCEIGGSVEEPAERELLSILLGLPRPIWATGMSLRAMSSLAIRLGAIHVFGPSLKEVSSFSPTERMDLLAIGWPLFRGGPDAFLLELSASLEMGSAKSPQLAYGEVYRWLARTEEPGLDQCRSALAVHAERYLRLDSDKEIFGTIVTARPALKTKSRDAKGSAQEPELEVGGSKEMRELLSLTEAQLVRYLKAVDRDRLPSRPHVSRFDVGQLKASLESVERNKPRHSSIPNGLIQVMKAGTLARTWPTVVREVRAGRLPLSGVLQHQRGLYRWLVDPATLQRFMPKGSPTAGVITCNEASKRLGVPLSALTALRRAGLVSYESLIGPRDRLTEGPTLTSIEHFERDYLTARSCARLCGIRVRRMNSLLHERGIEPFIPGHRDIVAIYSREPALEALKDLIVPSNAQSSPIESNLSPSSL